MQAENHLLPRFHVKRITWLMIFSSLLPLYTYINLPELIQFYFDSDSKPLTRTPISKCYVSTASRSIVDNVTGLYHIAYMI